MTNLKIQFLAIALVLIPGALFSQEQDDPIMPPIASQYPVELTIHGDVRVDPYYWMNERTNPEVIEYLTAENQYVESRMASTSELQEKLYQEMRARIVEEDSSAPYLDNGFWYYTRYEVGKQYPIYCRSLTSDLLEEEVMLDVNQLANDSSYFAVRGNAVSSNNRLLAYAFDDVGRRIYQLRVKDLETGELLDEAIPDVTGNIVWANDNQTFFYTRQDLQTLRSFQIYRHRLGTSVDDDVLVYEEKDETFRCSIRKSRSNQFLMIVCSQTLSDEVHVLNADTPNDPFQCFQPRRPNLEYSIDHLGDRFYIRTNDDAINFRLMTTQTDETTIENWKEVEPHRENSYLQSFLVFDEFLVLQVREEGLTRIRLRGWDDEEFSELDFGEQAYSARLGTNRTVDTDELRYQYTSMTTPSSTIDYDMRDQTQTIRKQQTVLGGFDSDNYLTERIWVAARDGTKVPVSIVRHRTTPLDGTAPLMLYGYGSYGSSTDARFSSDRLCLLDRGFVFAIAHIRGGQELGRQWYEDGKMFNKMNTFTDFVDVADALADQGKIDPKRMYARGGSAGGLLIGAVINLRPELFHGVVADVPFVDVVTTMLDDSIPLTTGEYDEWGNPNIREQYDYMLSYSPYDNVAAVDYPHMLVTTGLHDSQVQYWEPAKWVARLRETKTDENLLLLKTNMTAGHGGASGRFDRLREIAFRYAFLLSLSGVQE